jgi:hypothetical protein
MSGTENQRLTSCSSSKPRQTALQVRQGKHLKALEERQNQDPAAKAQPPSNAIQSQLLQLIARRCRAEIICHCPALSESAPRFRYLPRDLSNPA